MATPPNPPAARYRVILRGRVLPEHDRAAALDALAELFHSTPSRMQRLLHGHPTPLKKTYRQAEAEQICDSIRAAGVVCDIEKFTPHVTLRVISKAAPQAIPKATQADRDEPAVDSPQDAAAPGTDQAAPGTNQAAPPDLHSALLQFVDRNTDYYRRQFARFGDLELPQFKFSWHWPAFFAFFLWAMYRKMWMWSGVYLIGGLLLQWINPSMNIYLLWLFIWPLTANYLYLRHCLKHLRHPARGGVSITTLWLGVGLLGTAMLISLNTFTAHWQQLYTEQLQFAPALRGDQSRVDELTTLAPTERTTLHNMAEIATLLRLFITKTGLSLQSTELQQALQRLQQTGLPDAWQTPIRINLDLDSRNVTLRSAGADKHFNNQDDLVQTVYFGSTLQ